MEGEKMIYKEINIEIGKFAYPYILGNDCTSILEKFLSDKNHDKYVIITDENVGALYLDHVLSFLADKDYIIISTQSGEAHKTLATLEYIINNSIKKGATKYSCVITLGGGLIGNIGGLAASLLFKGIPFIHIPTTLLAALDSVISLKQAINTKQGKNLIGTYYPPSLVISDIAYLKSLNPSEVKSGLCEVIKNTLSVIPEEFDPLLNTFNQRNEYSDEQFIHFIDTSVECKLNIMKTDCYERKDAMIFEYGHTIGHAIEFLSHGRITHGESIGMGMVSAARISYELGYCNESLVEKHIQLLSKLGAAITIPKYIGKKNIIKTLQYDNKRTPSFKEGVIPMILLESPGKPILFDDSLLNPIPIKQINDVL